MSDWRMAKSLEVLRKEINGVWPSRDKTSDGGVGDTAHGARNSKHNPGDNRVVEARDFDEDVSGKDGSGGRPLWDLVQHLVALGKQGHPALGPGSHIIYEGRIWSDKHNWVERSYTGENAHKHHVHVAVSDAQSGYDSEKPWGVAKALQGPPKAVKKADRWLGLANPEMTGQDVKDVQDALRRCGNDVKVDGRYGRATADLVKKFQANRSIDERGVGPQTWAALRKVGK